MDFFQKTAPAIKNASSQKVGGLTYNPKDHGELDAFQKSEAFAILKKEFIARLDQIQAFAVARLSSGEAKLVVDGLKLIQQRLFVENYYEQTKAALLSTGKASLDQLCLLMNRPAAQARGLDVIMDLVRDSDKCAGGITERLSYCSSAVRMVDAGQDLRRIKEDMVQQLIVAFLDEYYIDIGDGGMHIHYVNAFTENLADYLGLSVHPSEYKRGFRLTDQEVDECLAYVLERLTPAAISLRLAEECLAMFAATMHDVLSTKNGETIDSFVSAEDGFQVVKNALIPVLEKCGAVPTACFISPAADAGRACVNRDPALLARAIMESEEIFKSEMLVEQPKPESFFCNETKVAIRHYEGKFFWAEESGAPALLDVCHLQGFLPEQFGETGRQAMYSAILNSSPDELSRYLSPDWLNYADMTQLHSKLPGDMFTRFLKQHAPLAKHLTQEKQLELAVQLFGQGTALDLAGRRDGEVSALGRAIGHWESETVALLGNIAKEAYVSGILDDAGIAEFLACGVSAKALNRLLSNADEDTVNAFAALLLDIDAIRRTEGKHSPYLSLPVPEQKINLRMDYLRARSHRHLLRLQKNVGVALYDAKRGLLRRGDSNQLLQEIRFCRIALFLTPGKMRDEKEAIFTGIVDQWQKAQEAAALSARFSA